MYLGSINGIIYNYKVSSLITSSDSKIPCYEIKPFDNREGKINRFYEYKLNFVGQINSIQNSRDGKRSLVSFTNGNFYIYNTKHETTDYIYISQSEDELRELAWVNGSNRSNITPNHEVYLEKSKIADLGVWDEEKYSRVKDQKKMIWDQPLYKPPPPREYKAYDIPTDLPKYGKFYLLCNAPIEAPAIESPTILNKQEPSPIKEPSVKEHKSDMPSEHPISGYFKVDDPSIQYYDEAIDNSHITDNNSNVPEVDESMLNKESLPVTVQKLSGSPSQGNKVSKWNDYSSQKESPKQPQAPPALLNSIPAPFNYIQSPTPQFMRPQVLQPPLNSSSQIPPNLVFQAPDGTLITYKQQFVQDNQQIVRDDASVQTDDEFQRNSNNFNRSESNYDGNNITQSQDNTRNEVTDNFSKGTTSRFNQPLSYQENQSRLADLYQRRRQGML